MGWLHTLFAKVEGFFTSPKAVAVEKTIAELMPAAMEIVTEINTLAPNRTLSEINTIAAKYALPTIEALGSDPANAGNTLLNLATSILQKNHAPAEAISTLNTVVQLAVVAAKAAK